MKKVNFLEMTGNKTNIDYISISQQFLYAAKTGKEINSFIHFFSIAGLLDLTKQLPDDETKKAFFINLYNAYIQVLLGKEANSYNDRKAFFTNKQILFAGQLISLDKLEHGILRRSKVKWGLGYINKLFPDKMERQLRVDKVDYRIHFALNCGAKSCPPIAFYKPEEINKQLDMATSSYLLNEVEYDKEKHLLILPAIMSWFRGDFGGKKKDLALCSSLKILSNINNITIKYKPYNWDLQLNNYINF